MRAIPLIILIVMLVFGYYQESAKVALNEYRSFADSYSGFYDSTPQERSAIFNSTSIPFTIHLFSKSDLVLAKSALSAIILLVFFMLDAVFVKVTSPSGAPSALPWLLLLYIGVSIPMSIFFLLSQTSASPSYAVSRELLGFLQSPLPSLILVYIPRFLKSPLPRFKFSLKRYTSI
ncbi:MAG: hypothetical protein COA49_00995 [Bacteroidetes bacterium]|nr:MAG: hypothetical protein COA49_00995 [Bacteroidota bacterium]